MATVTVSSTTTTTKISPDIRFDKSYIYTVPAWLKLGQIIISLIGFICVQVTNCYFCSQVGWYSFVSMVAFWVTLVLLIFYLFHIIERLHFIPWLLMELVFCGVWSAFFLIAGIVVATQTHDPAFGAAAFFGFVAAILFGVDAFFKFKAWRSGEIAQGERTTTTQTTSPTSPNYPAY